MLPRPSSLAGRLRELQRELHATVAADLRGVTIDVVRGLPLAACAWGERVAVAERVLQLEGRAALGVLVHELAHVFQQRAGRPRATGACHDVEYCDDEYLEAEAEAAATVVRRGGRWQPPALPTGAAPVRLLQPLVTVGGQDRLKLEEFSANFQAVLPLITSGPEWLTWALDPAAPAFAAPSETQLLAQIQFGTQSTRIAVFQPISLRLAPELLMNLGTPDFSNVVTSLQNKQLTAAAAAVLSANGYRTGGDFGVLDTTLAGLGMAGQLSLDTSSLPDQILLYQQFVGSGGPVAASPNNIAAAGFAASVAETATDFAAAYSFYNAVMAQSSPDATTVPPYWTGMTPLVMDYLRCPSLVPGADDATVAAALTGFLNQWPSLGFRTVGSAIYNCAVNGGLKLNRKTVDPAASTAIPDYMRTAKGALQVALASGAIESTLCQDGVTQWYSFSNSEGEGQLTLDANGCLTLASFVPA